MDVYTASTAIRANADTVFDYLANPENQPNWAVNFVRSTRPLDDGRWAMDTPVGEMTYRIDADPVRRTVDWLFETPAGDSVLPARVVSAGDGSLVTFTIVRTPDQPVDVWEGGKRGMDEELGVLRDILERAGGGQ